MNQFILNSVPYVQFGQNSIKKLTSYIKKYEGKLLLITGSSFYNSSYYSELKTDLSQNNIEYFHCFAGGEPTISLIDSITEKYKDFNIGVVTAIGGGSILDAGKAVSAMLTVNGKTEDYLEGIGTLKHPGTKIPFIAVPTTAGTGSEATKNAVISKTGLDGYKKSLRHDNFVPTAVFLDPSLTIGLPKSISLLCAMDTIAQLLESYISTKSFIYTDSIAFPALLDVLNNIEKLQSESADEIEVREKLLYSSFVSGITLAHAGLGICHGIAGVMGGLYPIPHGAACANMLSPSISFTVEKALEKPNEHQVVISKLSSIYKHLKNNHEESDVYNCQKLADHLEKLTEKLNIPKLIDFGITEENLENIAKISDSKNSPIKTTADDIKKMLLLRL